MKTVSRKREHVASADRRSSERFEMERDLEIKVTGKKDDTRHSTGKTVNMSSSGILFSCGIPLNVGTKVEANISWPAQINGAVSLELFAQGVIVRIGVGVVAMRIEKYDFKISRRFQN